MRALLYQILHAALLVLVAPILLLVRRGHHLPTLRHRLGLAPLPHCPAHPVWIHAVSVGEVNVARTLIRDLEEDAPLVITTVTPTGQDLATRTLAERASITYLPFDLGPCIDRFLRHFDPRCLLLIEGELWPLLMSRLRARGTPIVMVNGRISDRSFLRMRRLRPLLGPLLRPVDRFCVQTEDDARRLHELGVAQQRLVVTGNLKFETAPPPPLPELETRIRELAAHRPILVAGSTMEGEDEKLLEAMRGLGALLLLAPRHPERWNGVEQLCRREGMSCVRRSRFDGDGVDEGTGAPPDVVLLDSIGELAALYRLADVAFVGGTLVPTGGHNPLEPAQFGKAVVVGPSMDNFREIAAEFEDRNAWIQLRNAAELSSTLARLIADPDEAAAIGERARRLLEANRGASQRTVREIVGIVGIPGVIAVDDVGPRPPVAGADS